MIKRYCDICDEQIKSDNSATVDINILGVYRNKSKRYNDTCNNCVIKILKFIDNEKTTEKKET